MSGLQYLAAVAAVILGLIRISLQILRGKDDQSLKKWPSETAIDTIMLSWIFYATLAMSAKTLPEIQLGLGALYGISQDSTEFTIVEKAVNARRSIDAENDSVIKAIFSDYLSSQTSTYSEVLEAIHAKKARISSAKAMDFGRSAFTAAQKFVDTTSYVSPVEWWLKPEGRAYLLANEDAISRKVAIRRIFIYRTADELKLLDPIIKEQRRIGIDVYAVSANALPESLSKDIIIVDGKLVGELVLNPSTRMFSDVSVDVDSREIERVTSDWELLKRFSKKVG